MESKIKYVLDTNICIYLIKQKSEHLQIKLAEVAVEQVAISVITFSELQYGVYKSKFSNKNDIALMQFLAPITILPFEQKHAIEYGKIRSNLENRGLIIGGNDLYIGAHVLAESLTLVTNNEKEFCRIKNLQIENWTNS